MQALKLLLIKYISILIKMRKYLFFASIILGMVFASCTKNYNYSYEIENVTVQFTSKELLATTVKPFAKQASVGPNNTQQEYEHVFPAKYKAYLVSKETKGEYTAGQLVKVIEVAPGNNTITIPKLNYDIYVTNYEKAGEWYKWNDAIQQLPQSSTVLYLYGKNSIDYSKVKAGSVELENPYSGVMIANNKWVPSAPKFYNDGSFYTLVQNDQWYLLYVRANNTNTQVPISIPGNPNQHYTLSRAIEPNNIYQYTIDGSVAVIDDGNLGIVVKPLEKTIKETIKL